MYKDTFYALAFVSVHFSDGKFSGIWVTDMGYVVYVCSGSGASTTLYKVILSTVRSYYNIKQAL